VQKGVHLNYEYSIIDNEVQTKVQTKVPPRLRWRGKRRALLVECAPPKHDYPGYIFSSQTERPPKYYKDYFLPVYSQPRDRQHVHIIAPPVPAEKILRGSEAPSNLMPLSTVKVQWGVRRNGTAYKLEDIYNYMARFGPVDHVYPWTINSALVVFASLVDARGVATHSRLGAPWDHLVTSWFEPRLNNYNFFKRYAVLEGVPFDEALLV